MLEHRGYRGHVEYDGEARLFHGEVAGLRDVVTFQGRSVEEIEESFRDSVDDYLEFCEERGEDPDRAFSGKFMVRVDPELHRKVTLRAELEGKSLNQLISEQLKRVG
ncbi:type II toxin-antitoxin system HicB family antitoxin [soil metagenome]|jgi:predicted HicB family RNase H-like nuclease